MTKAILLVLVLVGLTLGIMWVWFSDRPVTDQVNVGTESEQTQIAAGDSITRSLPGKPSVATESPGISIDTSATRTKSRLVQPTRGELPASAFPDDEQAEGLAISGLVQDEEGYPLANIEVLVKPIHIFVQDLAGPGGRKERVDRRDERPKKTTPV